MIRPAVPADTAAIVQLGVDAKMFLADEVEPLRQILEGFHAGTSSADHQLYVWANDVAGPPVGVVFFGPDAMTDRKWDLWMIAVAPERQGLGIGGELLRFTEERIRGAGGRLLLVDTSSRAKYDPTRAFYAKHGLVEVARVPDFYADGDGKVTYWKRMG